MEALHEIGAKRPGYVARIDEQMELKRSVSDISHKVHSQVLQTELTQKRVAGITIELKKDQSENQLKTQLIHYLYLLFYLHQ